MKINRISALILCCIIIIPSALLFTNKSFIKTSAYQLLYGYSQNDGGINSRLKNIIANIDVAVSDYVGLRQKYINIHGLLQKTIGSKYVDTGKRIIIKHKSGAVSDYYDEDKTGIAAENAQKIVELKQELDKRGIPLLFVVAPCKFDKYNYDLPYNLKDTENAAGDAFVEVLAQGKVSTIDLRDYFHEKGWKFSDCFFVSDCHWKPEYGLKSWQYVTEQLKALYGFDVDSNQFDLQNYDTYFYKNCFLGTSGTVLGDKYSAVDGITQLTPKFATSITLENDRLNYDKAGTLEELIINKSAIVENNYAASLPLNLYYARDSVITNKLSKNDINAVFVRDSFGGIIGGFVSLTFNKTYIVDMRTIKEHKIDTLNDLIDSSDTDIIIFLYNTDMLTNDYMFDF